MKGGEEAREERVLSLKERDCFALLVLNNCGRRESVRTKRIVCRKTEEKKGTKPGDGSRLGCA